MREAVIIDCLRTPIGRHRGGLAPVRPDDLGAHAIRTLVSRSKVDPALIDDVYWGAANQAGEDNRNAARMALLLAGLPDSVPGATVNRLCASGLEAVAIAARMIEAGHGDVFIAGGCESMSRAPLVMPKPDEPWVRGNQTMFDTTLGWRMTNPKLAKMHQPFSMGETAENVAEKYKLTREAQDKFALESQMRCKTAVEAGRLAEEIVPIDVEAERGKKITIDKDEHPRFDTTLEGLAKLKPAFREGGTVTAGNSSGLNDGAAALLMMEAKTAERLGMKPMAFVRHSASAGVDPACMGLGPVPATKKALARAGWKLSDVDLIEINEAFAAQVLACVRELDIDPAKLNVNGGAIALGHPLGCSGARLATTIVREMNRARGEARIGCIVCWRRSGFGGVIRAGVTKVGRRMRASRSTIFARVAVRAAHAVCMIASAPIIFIGLACSQQNSKAPSAARETPTTSVAASQAITATGTPVDWAEYGLLLSRVVAPDAIRWDELRESRALIERMLARLAANGPASTPAQFPDASVRTAYYINAHNLMMLAEMESVLSRRESGRWPPTIVDARASTIDGTAETVFTLQAKALKASGDDWRVRMALFSGRRDGPAQWPWIILSDMLDVQLDEITRAAIASPRVVQIDHGLDKRLLLCDELFEIQGAMIAEYERRVDAQGASILNVLLEWAKPFDRETLNSAVGYGVAKLPRDARLPVVAGS